MTLPREDVAAFTESAREDALAATCAVCGRVGMEVFYEVDSIPTQSCVLLDSAGDALAYPTGDLVLALCNRCGFIQNVRFDPDLVDYSRPTEESQAFSGKFQAFARDLARRLFDRYHLEGRSVLEVGCGKGDFMRLLVEFGVGSGVGIDPGFLPDRVEGDLGAARFIRDWFGPSHLDLTGDLVLSRHLLEHIPNVGEFLGWLSTATEATPGARLFTEVPDVARVLAEGAFWDVYYEHCSYFTLGSLGRALRRSGLKVEDLEQAFEDQYLLAAAVPSGDPGPPHPAEEAVEDLVPNVAAFSRSAAAARRRWSARIWALIEDGRRVCLWGGGSKAVAFLTTLGLGEAGDSLTVVDINVHKQGKWLPGTGVCVSAPERLLDEPPALVVPMNVAYVDEIRSDLEVMGLAPPIEAV